jgi:hypothetical protein
MTTGDLHATQELTADAGGDFTDLLTVQETAQGDVPIVVEN